MIDAQEMADRILSELEEYPQDNPVAMLNTVITPTGYAVEISVLQMAILKMVRDGNISLAFDANLDASPNDQALSEVNKLAERIQFNPQTQSWAYLSRNTKRVPELLLTEKGLTRARELLGQRGYRWWLQPPQ